MKFIGHGMKTEEEIERTFGLTNIVAEMHLALLEKAVMIEKSGEGYRSTSIGIAYLKNFEDNAPGIGFCCTLGCSHYPVRLWCRTLTELAW